MRKQDYATLADIIRTEYQKSQLRSGSMSFTTVGELEAKAECIKTIARQFAKRSHVEENLFLKACGIE